jgi:[NiFe] hydrogenase diaphorase moiety large subunit
VVNNCETLCCVTQILEKGPATFNEFGSEKSSGTKVLSISGDCMSPGIYELPYGTKLSDILKMAGAENALAVQVGGPSGSMVGPEDFHRAICFDDLATGGSIMVFGPERNLLEIAEEFMRFFVEESCGFCTPCRVGNVLLKERLARINSGRGELADLDYLQSLGESIKMASRCGLGQTSPNPVLTTLKKFRGAYEALVNHSANGKQPSFDIRKALSDAQNIIGRQSVHFPEEQETLT